MGLLEKILSLLARQPGKATQPQAMQPEVAPRPIDPFLETAAPARPFTERRRRKRIDARRGTRVLIIDDSPTVLAVMKKFLTSVGYVTFEALDAESGIAMLRTHAPQLIFLDIVLPGMDGFAALRQIRRDPLSREIPVIMMSGNEQAAEQFYANRIGADDFMKKPFTRRDVFMSIEPLLDEILIPRHLKRIHTAPTEAKVRTATPRTAP